MISCGKTKLHSRWKERPKYSHFAATDLAPSQRMAGPCWSAQSSLCALVSLCPTSSPSQRSPVGLSFFLYKSDQFQITHGVLHWRLKVVDSACFVFRCCFFFFFPGEQGKPFRHLCGFHICCWWKRYTKADVGDLLLSVEVVLTSFFFFFFNYDVFKENFHCGMMFYIPSGHSAMTKMNSRKKICIRLSF